MSVVLEMKDSKKEYESSDTIHSFYNSNYIYYSIITYSVTIYVIHYVCNITKYISRYLLIKFLQNTSKLVKVALSSIMSNDIYPEKYNSREEAKLDVIMVSNHNEDDDIKKEGIALCSNTEIKCTEHGYKVVIYEEELNKLTYSKENISKNERSIVVDNNTTNNYINSNEFKFIYYICSLKCKENGKEKKEYEENEMLIKRKWEWNIYMHNIEKSNKESDSPPNSLSEIPECEVANPKITTDNSNRQKKDIIKVKSEFYKIHVKKSIFHINFHESLSKDKSRIDEMIITYMHYPKKRKKETHPPPDPPTNPQTETPQCEVGSPNTSTDNCYVDKKEIIEVKNELEEILSKKSIILINTHESPKTDKIRIDDMIINYIHSPKRRKKDFNPPPDPPSNPPSDNPENEVGSPNNIIKVENGFDKIFKKNIYSY